MELPPFYWSANWEDKMRPNMRKKYESYINLVKEFQDDVGGPFPLQNATLDFEDLDKYFTVINLTDTIEKVQWCMRPIYGTPLLSMIKSKFMTCDTIDLQL